MITKFCVYQNIVAIYQTMIVCKHKIQGVLISSGFSDILVKKKLICKIQKTTCLSFFWASVNTTTIADITFPHGNILGFNDSITPTNERKIKISKYKIIISMVVVGF